MEWMHLYIKFDGMNASVYKVWWNECICIWTLMEGMHLYIKFDGMHVSVYKGWWNACISI